MMFDTLLDWFKTHRAPIGGLFLGLATIVGGAGTIYGNDHLLHAGALAALVGGTLTGAGMAKSDQYHREKLELLQNKIDRRSSDSLIPVRDLQKLMATDKPTNGEKE